MPLHPAARQMLDAMSASGLAFHADITPEERRGALLAAPAVSRVHSASPGSTSEMSPDAVLLVGFEENLPMVCTASRESAMWLGIRCLSSTF